MAVPSRHDALLHLRAHDRDIARVIARRFLLFVGSLVLFIDDDQSEILERREDGAARADHDPRAAGLNLVPFIVPLAFGQMAVQDRDHLLRFGEAALESLDRLRRERNFRDEHDGRFSAREGRTDRLQINLRLAAAGHAVEQNRLRVFRRGQRFLDRAQGSRLLQIQGEIGRRDELLIRVRIARDRFFAQRHEPALLQRAQRLVIERSLAQQIRGRDRSARVSQRPRAIRPAAERVAATSQYPPR